MRHRVDGRKFGRNTSHRVAMFRNMANSVIMLERVVTTVQKAKETRRVVDRLITLGKKDTLASRRLAFDRTRDDAVVGKLFAELSKRYEKRAGGYTRVLKLADQRRGDAAEMAVLELVDHMPILRGKAAKPASAKKKDAKEGDEKSAVAPADPMKKFRKIFAGGRGGKVATGGGAAGKSQRSATRKTSPAGGGGGKSGGSA